MRLIAAVRDWLDAERYRLPLWLPVFMGTGVLVYYALRFEPTVWLGPAILIPLLAASVAWRAARWLLAPLAAMALGFAAAQVATARALPLETDLPFRATTVSGTVLSVEMTPDSRRILIQPAFLDDAAQPLRRSVRVRLRPNDDAVLDSGDSIRVRAVIRIPSYPSYPGAWDTQRAAFYTGLGASGYAVAPAERTARAASTGPAGFVQMLRETIAQHIMAVIPGSSGAIAVGFLTGIVTGIPAADYAAFRDSGLMHLLSVSGLHIAIVMAFVLVIVRFGFALSEWASLHWPTKKLAALCALAAGGAYTVLVGMQVPIMRCFVMASLVTLAILADRRGISLRGLALAAIAVMLAAPWEVPGASLQMSFSAVLALVSGYEALRPWLRRLHGRRWYQRVLSHLVALALSSVLAGSASAPYAAYQFGRMQVYFVLANMVAVPLTSVWVMPAGFIALLLMPVHLEWPALVVMGWGVDATLWIARFTAALPDAAFNVPHMPAWGLCVFSLGLAWLGLWQTRRRLLGIAFMVVGLASPALNRPPDLLVSGDARLIVLRTPQGVFLQQGKGVSKFTLQAWSQYLAVDVFQPIADNPAAGIRCEPGACLLRPHADRRGALLARGAQHPDWCDQVSVIVSAEPARGLCPRPWPALVDRFTVWRSGSAAIWLERGGARIVTDRTDRDDRPWVPPVPKPRPPPPSKLPPAAVDEGTQPGTDASAEDPSAGE